ncbi:methionine adenosyltransferase [Natrinema hispanicum]|uniref:Methionine adenosyltransferase n=1 Tax=Natrinema hispanicum TaxID=392421 RepID=A0A1G6Q2R0_9EURY|nr:methionine adenosyltransferase [Natrinema hispanicum]SDC86720.1 methionine adenosyltransferase [Natrinema hispanicum]SET30662.1 S-adenosylmethionine synthetase [Natrinema hispanicum]
MDVSAVSVSHLDRDPVAARPTEFVERKGLGHPDSICDGIAEAVSRRLSQYYLEEFGHILHHNTDSVQLVAGTTEPAFGGGEIVDPIYVLISGRATTTVDGQDVPVDDLAIDAARDYVDTTFDELPADAVEFDPRIGETSADLKALFDEQRATRANDTSIGVGYAPLSNTERMVRGLEPAIREEIPAVGEDVKVLGWRTDDELRLTVAAAVVSRHVATLEEYVDVVAQVENLTTRYASDRTERDVHVDVNAADDIDTETVYLTETGLSAEMGDDGNVGRGNRVNGLITPHRSMSLEATAGKNPVSHVGKLYNIVATNAAERINQELDAEYTGIKLLSQIGAPVAEPQAIGVETTARDDDELRRLVAAELEGIDSLARDIVAGDVQLF